MAAKRILANYTTKVPVEETLAEVQQLLVAGGAQSIALHYEAGKVQAIDFTVKLDGHPLQFRLPQNAASALAVLKRQKVRANMQKLEHAERVSWRILRDWVRAQLAMVELSQAELAQVFLPYAVIGGTPVYRQFREQRQLQLGDGKQRA